MSCAKRLGLVIVTAALLRIAYKGKQVNTNGPVDVDVAFGEFMIIPVAMDGTGM